MPQMMPNNSEMAAVHETPPWSDTTSWQEANKTLSYLVNRYEKELKWAKMHAERIGEGLQSLCGPMDSLCMRTCPWCPTPCCQSAKVWIGAQDLLFIYLMGIKAPERQLLASYSDICCYFGPRGCTLSRYQRPFICTWYLCPTQKAILRTEDTIQRSAVERTFDLIKAAREEMENAFIRAVA